MHKPFAQSCENNKDYILQHLKILLSKPQQVLEIGSGTGQHAVYFAEQLPHVQWLCSERQEHHPGLSTWINDSPANNLQGPINLDVQQTWPVLPTINTVFSANTLHIMPWSAVEAFFHGAANLLKPGETLIVYGPFNYHGQFTSASNQQFDLWLKSQGAHQGIRDMHSQLLPLAQQTSFRLQADQSLPANNRLLVWLKQ